MAEQIVRVIMEGAAAPANAPASGTGTGTAIAAGSGKPPGWTDGLRRPGRSFADISPVGTPINGNGMSNGTAFTNRLWSVGRSFDQITGNGLNRINQENGTALRQRLASVGKSFDPNVEALKIMERQARKQAVSDAYARISPAGVPLGVRVGNYLPGMAPPPIQLKQPTLPGKPPAPSDDSSIVVIGLTRSAVAVTLALTALNQVLDLTVKNFRGNLQARAMIVADNDVVGGRMKIREIQAQNATTGGTIVGGVMGAIIGAAGGFAAGNVPGAIAGGIAGAAGGAGLGYGAGKAIGKGIELEGVPDEKMLANAQALGTRMSRLGEYGGQIRAGMMNRQIEQMRLNIAEANELGPIGGRLLAAQTENDRYRQVMGAIEANKNAQEQEKLLAKENQFLRQEIVKLNKTVAGAAELTRRILEGGKTPLDNILGGHMQMPTDHPHAPIAKKLQQQINIPLIIPAFAEVL